MSTVLPNMNGHQTLFSYTARVVACANCAAPIEAQAAGQTVTCSYCRTPNHITAREETQDRQLAQTAPTMGEAQRYERLRAQDGKPVLPPPGLEHLLTQGGLTPQGLPAAQQEWQRARQELMHGASFGAAERLSFLTLLIYGQLASQKQDLQVRALLETALDHLPDARHRQVIHGMLARNAARVRDLTAAEQWLELCTPHSDDIHMDTAYRFSRAYVSTARGDYATVLQVLSVRPEDVPIADGSDHICGVLRANALERSGRGAEALQQLTQLMLMPGLGQLVGAIIGANAELQLCPHTYPQAQSQQQQTTSNVVKTASGVSIGPIFLVAFGAPVVGIAGAGILDALGVPKNDAVITVAVIGFIVVLLGTIFWSLSKGARVRAHLAKVGVRGQGQILSARETGTRVNHQPVIELLIQVEVPGMQPFRASHREILSGTMMARITPGSRVPVVVDPSDPRKMAIEWG